MDYITLDYFIQCCVFYILNNFILWISHTQNPPLYEERNDYMEKTLPQWAMKMKTHKHTKKKIHNRSIGLIGFDEKLAEEIYLENSMRLLFLIFL